jgi:hypothetical protein
VTLFRSVAVLLRSDARFIARDKSGPDRQRPPVCVRGGGTRAEVAVRAGRAAPAPAGASFADARTVGGEPFSEVAHATVISQNGECAEPLGSGAASCPEQAHASMKATGKTRTKTTSRMPGPRRWRRVPRNRCVIVAHVRLRDRSRVGPCAADSTVRAHFVPQSSDSVHPLRPLAKGIGLHDRKHFMKRISTTAISAWALTQMA